MMGPVQKTIFNSIEVSVIVQFNNTQFYQFCGNICWHQGIFERIQNLAPSENGKKGLKTHKKPMLDGLIQNPQNFCRVTE